MRGWWAPLLRCVASIVLLLLAWRLAGGETLRATFDAVDGALVATAIACTVPMHLLSAWRWRFTCARIGLPVHFADALREYYLASWLNTVLPGGVGGDAARVWRQGRTREHNGNTPSTRRLRAFQGPLHGVLLERFAGQCALFGVLLVGLAMNQHLLSELVRALPGGTWTGFALVAALLAAGSACAGWLLHTSASLRESLPTSSPSSSPRASPAPRRTRWFALARQLHADARRAFLPLPVLLVQGALSLAVVASYLVIFTIAAAALHAPIEWRLALFAIPIVLGAMIVPVSVGGLGLREATAAVLWPLFGMSAGAGAASALLYGVVILIGAVPGAIVLLQRRAPA